jgi:hypothetical protein
MMTKKYLMTLLAVLCCAMTMVVMTACSNDDDNLAPGVDKKIVGNWFSDVSGMTYAKWNYGKTWQNTKFNADGTGSTRIYYTMDDNAIGCEKIDFTYKASADGVVVRCIIDASATCSVILELGVLPCLAIIPLGIGHARHVGIPVSYNPAVARMSRVRGIVIII